MVGMEERSNQKKASRFSVVSLIVLALGIVGIVLFALVVLPAGITRGAQAAEDRFVDTVSQTESTIRGRIYDAAFDLSEKEHHVKNNAAVEIKCVELTQKLEVLRVSDMEYVFTGIGITDNVRPEQYFESSINNWFEVTGTGSFTVDLTQAEVVIDNTRRHISVILPTPEIKCKGEAHALDPDGNEFNLSDSISEGIEISKKAQRIGLGLVNESVSSDPNYMDSARTAAKRLLSNMIKSLNAEEIPDLSVDISFFDEQV